MSHYNLGIDTGGTYTDAVIVDSRERQVIASAKALTTRGDLALGIIESLDKVLQASAGRVSGAEIGLVSLSTTLATNALVEGKGSHIAVVLIGFDDTMTERTELASAIPTAKVIRIAGGHRYDGGEQAPLDEAALRTAVASVAAQVEAYAVSALYSVRNSEHERRAQALIREITACPVTASYELSESLNGPRRALTAAFNARIIAMIVALVASVRQVMAKQCIVAPLMIVKGDGSLASADTVVEKPIEIILSGPAASVIGANFLSGLQDFIISDVGGTTTDVAIVRHGWPELNDQGAMVGVHRTLVKAIDIQTIGLGGDSEIAIEANGAIQLKPNRVVPISLIGSRWPSVQKTLQTLIANSMGLGIATLFILRPEGYGAQVIPADLPHAERDLLAAVGHEPKPWSAIVNNISDRYRIARLVERGLLQLAGFTPSDAAHVLGLQSQWSREVAMLACLMIGRSYGKISFNEQQAEAECVVFAEEIFQAMVKRSTHVMLERLTNTAFAANDPLVSLIAGGQQLLRDLKVSLRSALTLVAVGGSASVFYPEVGRRLGTKTVIPAHSEVANAVGAAIGLMRVQSVIEITSATNGGYFLHGEGEPIWLEQASDALAEAQRLAQIAAEQQVAGMDGIVLETQTLISDRLDIPNLVGDKGLVSAKVAVVCLGRPNLS